MTEEFLPSSFGILLAAAAAGTVLLGHRESLRRTSRTTLSEACWIYPGLLGLFGARLAYIFCDPELRARPVEWLHFSSGGLLGWAGLLAAFMALVLPSWKNPRLVAARLDTLSPALAWLVAVTHLGCVFTDLGARQALGDALLALLVMAIVQWLGPRQTGLGQTGLFTFTALPLGSLLIDWAVPASSEARSLLEATALLARVGLMFLCLLLWVSWSKTAHHRASLLGPNKREIPAP